MRRLQLGRFFTSVAALAVVTAGAGGRPARANCVSPPPEIVWSYPRDGQVDVPTNATIWILLSNWHRPRSVQLDGKDLPVNAFGFGYLPTEPMAPGTAHTITFDGAAMPPAAPLTIRFTTASGETEREPAMTPAVTSVVAAQARPLSTACQRVVHAMDCFDTGQDTHLVFNTEARPFVWIVERVAGLPGESPVFNLWPGECELPGVFVGDAVARACTHRYRLHAVEVTGLRAMSTPFCVNELLKAPDGEADAGVSDEIDGAAPTDDAAMGGAIEVDGGAIAPGGGQANPNVTTVDSSGGCSLSHGSSGGNAALGLLLLLVLWRRRRSPPR